MEKMIKVARLGDSAYEMAVEDTWTVRDVKEATDFSDHEGQVTGIDSSGNRTNLTDSSMVNGYDTLIFANKVKGG